MYIKCWVVYDQITENNPFKPPVCVVQNISKIEILFIQKIWINPIPEEGWI